MEFANIASTVLVALIVGAAPLGVVIVQGRQHRRDKREDWRRQDEVAARLVDSSETTNTKLEVIHTLVNSDRTKSINGELAATVRDLASLSELIALRITMGQQPSPEALAEVEAAEERVVELEAELEDRRQQAALVAVQTVAQQQ